jgi:hypothetical protein
MPHRFERPMTGAPRSRHFAVRSRGIETVGENR